MIVLDADARISPDTVRRLASAVRGNAFAATARRRMLRPRGGTVARVLATLQDDEETLDGAVQLARLRLGGGSELRGNGMVVRGAALADVGGWPVDAVCEDLELSTRLFLRHHSGVVWLSDVSVWEQPVLRFDALVRQRLRWAEGAIRRDIRLVLPALGDPTVPVRGRIDVAAYAAHLLLGWFVAGLVVSGRAGRRVAATLLRAYAVATLVLAADALRRFDDAADRGVARVASITARSIGVTAFVGAWLPVTSFAWLGAGAHGDAVHFERTLKSAGFERLP